MHLHDGYLDAKTALLCTGASVVGVGIAVRQVRSCLEARQMPLLGLSAAFVFAAQMLNFPVVDGTSGHLVGGVLIAILLGPSAAILVITCVLMVQCLMFADGGLMALGANVLNMAVVSVCGGYFVFRALKWMLRMEDKRATVFAAAFASWCGTVLASIACAGELALSKTLPWSFIFPAMANVHMLIGVGEGVATSLIVLAVLRNRPQLVAGIKADGPATWAGFIGYGLLVALALAVFVAPFACPWPDGLEAVAGALGFANKATPHSVPAPLEDYRLPWVGSVTLATAVAGAIGTVIAFISAYALARILVPPLSSARKHAPSGD